MNATLKRSFLETSKKEMHNDAKGCKVGSFWMWVNFFHPIINFDDVSLSAMIEGVAATHMGQLNDGVLFYRGGAAIEYMNAPVA